MPCDCSTCWHAECSGCALQCRPPLMMQEAQLKYSAPNAPIHVLAGKVRLLSPRPAEITARQARHSLLLSEPARMCCTSLPSACITVLTKAAKHVLAELQLTIMTRLECFSTVIRWPREDRQCREEFIASCFCSYRIQVAKAHSLGLFGDNPHFSLLAEHY